MEQEKNELLNMYLGAAKMLGEDKIPTDLKVIGTNLQGYPIVESKEQAFSFQAFVFNIGMGEPFSDDYPTPFLPENSK